MSEGYDLIVIGGGSAGLTAAVFGNGLGKKIALIECDRVGGDCTWTGCIPSKALLKVARVAHHIRSADQFGITVGAPVIDMAAVRQYVERTIRDVYKFETPEALEKRGIEIVKGEARFVDAETILVGERRMQAKKFIIATGGRAVIPAIPGLNEVAYKTNANFFENEWLPRHLLILGAGPVGMEMAQAYIRLGAQVTVIGEQIMPRDAPEAVEVLRRVFAREGVTLLETSVRSVGGTDEAIVLRLKDGQEIQGDMLLVAAGRTPNVESLNLEQAGVEYSAEGIKVNSHLQTNVTHIYAVGDVTPGLDFTHYAGFQGGVAARNALLPIGKGNGLEAIVPWVTFTDPEVAHAGMLEAEAREKYGAAVKVHTMLMAQGDRSIVEADTEGFIKLVYKGSGELLGATIVAARAGEMITEFTLVIRKKVSLRSLTGIMHPYPTYSEIAQRAIIYLVLGELLNGISGKIIKTLAKLTR
ncbi:MAG: FAD-dependent oxidoreductase [Chloroflexota bacterium]